MLCGLDQVVGQLQSDKLIRVEGDRPLTGSKDEASNRERARLRNNAGKRVSGLGRREEALQATAEAVRLTMPLVERYPRALREHFTIYVENLHRRCTESGQDPGADPLVRQASELLARVDDVAGG
jgi:hypothetical protein